jgi:F-type H+-transporting ATPase subunit a
MSDSQLLLASNEAKPAEHTATTAPAESQSSTHTADAHDAHTGSHDVPQNQVFNHLLGELGDHHGFVLFNHVMDLPIILVDNGGVDVYLSEHAMEAGGKYVMHKHHPVKKADMTAPQLDLSVTNYVFFQWIAMLLLFVVMRVVVGKYKKHPQKAPSGLQNAIESLVVYLRDTVVYANIPVRKAADRLLPYFLTVFFFILTLNFLGLVPGGHTATSSLSVTGALALTAFLVINITAIRESGIGAWFKHLLGGAPAYLAPIMVPVEILGLFTKPFALAMRLFANMSAGHMVLLVLMGLIFFFKSLLVAPLSVAFSLFIYCLEFLVVFLQAYIFTTLTAVFTGLAIGDHGHDEHHH